MTRKLYQDLNVSKPVVFEFNLDDSGNLFLSEVVVNFGLAPYSIVPTILNLNGKSFEDFILDVYFGFWHLT